MMRLGDQDHLLVPRHGNGPGDHPTLAVQALLGPATAKDERLCLAGVGQEVVHAG